ncbi:MAG: hypothetical protein CL789_03540 [Chloroflexi bacterium]|nr:hypothetical protein [Chloroflexota bacterium]
MKQNDIFATILRRNQESLLKAIEGLSHSEMFLQLPGQGNCMNWILGHIASYRDGMLVDSGLRSYMRPDEVQVYAGGSAPIKAGDICVDSARLSELLVLTFADLIFWIETERNGLHQKPVGDIKDNIGYSGVCNTLIEHYAQNIGHESIHVGELNPLRELALQIRMK